ncbi:MAG TPA: preprotein translocase subunit SecY [Verrucomicrobiae bacterium]|nr:preprotein translocase subunit SecY [Verrucomicrobiae bacterium]
MFSAIASTFSNCFKIPELKSRIFFTLLLLAICRLEAVVRIPGLNGAALAAFFNSHQGSGGMLGMYSMFTGGALEHCAVGALGIMPYISATIIIQLLTAVVPTLSKMSREEGGRTDIIKYGRYLTVILCIGQGFFMAYQWERPEGIFGQGIGQLVLYPPSLIWWYRIQTVIILTTGTMLLMWLGEQITDRGIGNGVSLIITIGILARLPQAFVALKDMFFPGAGIEAQFNAGHAIALVCLLAGVIAGVVAITQAQRKIPVQYAQRAVGRKVYSGGTSFMPLRVNYPGVMPIIFAQALLMFPQKFFQMAANYFSNHNGAGMHFIGKQFLGVAKALNEGAFWYLAIYSIMILFFSYFWVATQFNELQIADDLKKNGGYIPGVRPGVATSDYLHNAMSRITLAGAIFLTIIAVVPIILYRMMGIRYEVAQFFGGTSMLIIVGVLLDTMRQMESHLLMRHYDGFLKKGKLRGRFSG